MQNGLTYQGDRTIVLHRDLESVPVLARAGIGVADDRAVRSAASAPTTRSGSRCASTPAATRRSRCPRTPTTSSGPRRSSTSATANSSISPVRGAVDVVPAGRSYDLVLCGFARVDSVTVDGAALEVQDGPVPGSVVVALGEVDRAAELRATVAGDLRLRSERRRPRADLHPARRRADRVLDEDHGVVTGRQPARARRCRTQRARPARQPLPRADRTAHREPVRLTSSRSTA